MGTALHGGYQASAAEHGEFGGVPVAVRGNEYLHGRGYVVVAEDA